MLQLLFLLSSFSFLAWGSVTPQCPLKDGDSVFIKSQSQQSSLLRISTGSEWSHVGMAFKNKAGWEIIEAVGPIKWTSLYSFVRRSRNYSFQVKRPNFEFDAQKIKDYSEALLGKPYDLIFAWDDERWYCSELVWKAYKAVADQELGSLERTGDLNVNDPKIVKEAKRRFALYGIKFNEEEWKNYQTITPIQMMNAPNFIHIGSEENVSDFAGCFTNAVN